MIGGGLKIQKLFKGDIGSGLSLFLILLLVLLARAYIVLVTYNIIWPKLVSNSGADNSNFKPITYYESLLIVLLFSFMFR
tara:strand:- start:207 stop:446 length:240 start_codon:yes stop_codon:yes gene_type:complete